VGEARLTFLAMLRAGLRRYPEAAIDDVVADYASHFAVGAAQGRSDEEIAAALGDPLALADELRVEMRIGDWVEKPSATAAARLVAGVIGLGAVNTALVFFALPLVCLLVFLVIIGVALTLGSGVWMLFAGVSIGLALELSVLTGAGLILAGIALGALLTLLLFGLVNGLAAYARLHYRLLPRPLRADKDLP
jgi:uncharacterized membrane protein